MAGTCDGKHGLDYTNTHTHTCTHNVTHGHTHAYMHTLWIHPHTCTYKRTHTHTYETHTYMTTQWMPASSYTHLVDASKQLFEVGLDDRWVLSLAQNLQQVVVTQEVEPVQ